MSLEVNAELHHLLEKLAERLGASKSEVLRRGIALMEVGMEAREKGQRLALVDDDDQVKARIIGVGI